MRREKEIAESRFEVAQGESLRHRLRVEHLEQELKEVQDSLSAARERMQVHIKNQRGKTLKKYQIKVLIHSVREFKKHLLCSVSDISMICLRWLQRL